MMIMFQDVRNFYDLQKGRPYHRALLRIGGHSCLSRRRFDTPGAASDYGRRLAARLRTRVNGPPAARRSPRIRPQPLSRRHQLIQARRAADEGPFELRKDTGTPRW